MADADPLQRAILPIPDPQYVGVTTYDAKDPDTQVSRRSSSCVPPKVRPTSSIILIDDAGFGASSAFGGVINTPTAERFGKKRSEVQPLPYDCALLAVAGSAAHRTQSPCGRHGRHHRDRDIGTGLQFGAAEVDCAAP